MFRNHFKIAFRYLKSHPSFTIINILGLTLGFFCFFLLNAYVLKETSFDNNQEGVYRLLQKTTDENGTVREMAQSAPKVGIESERVFDEIENQTQILFLGRANIGNDPASITHQSFAAMDDNFLEIFNFHVLEGTVEELSNRPNGIILTRSIKELYFGQELALGKLLKMGDTEYPVVGVLDDFPENSHFENMVFISHQMASEIYGWFDEFMTSNWSNDQLITYFKILPGAEVGKLGEKITALTKENYPKDQSFSSTFAVQPVQDIHLYQNDVEGEMNKGKGNALYVNLFFWVGIFR